MLTSPVNVAAIPEIKSVEVITPVNREPSPLKEDPVMIPDELKEDPVTIPDELREEDCRLN